MGCLPIALVVLVLLVLGDSEPVHDKQPLLSFFDKVPHSVRLDWSNSTSVCSWSGILCDPTNTSVVKLRLPAIDLSGSIPPNSIGLLTGLKVLSLRANNLTGSIPFDFQNLSSLRSIFLQYNSFSGPFPLVLTNLPALKCLAIAGNAFSGEIPFAVNNLFHLKRLFLQNNSFNGSLPSAFPPQLTAFNVSYNHLNGSIPSTLSLFSTESFLGNDGLCGTPLSLCNPFFRQPGTSVGSSPAVHRSKRHPILFILLIVAGAILVLLLCFLVICCLWRKTARKDEKVPESAVARAGDAGAGGSTSKDATAGASISASEMEKNKLEFFNGGGNTFDLEDLLRASAEVLGKGSVGTSYKAVLEDGITVVVKRLKDVSVSRREFDAVMEVLGEVSNENVIPLRAYYYSRDEKLLVYDFFSTGSLAALLHGRRGKGRAPLDWDSRVRAVVGVAKGLAHLHFVNKVVHGNVKASNVLLCPDHAAAVSEFGLNPLFGNATQTSRLGGYRAPEVVESKKVTFKSDVYSFGVLLLEILTGKSPNQASLGDEGIDLPRWVQSVVREEWTAEVFDVELMRYDNIEEEMVQLLQIAMSCVSITPDQRPSMQDVLKMIVEIHHEVADDGQRQSSDDQS